MSSNGQGAKRISFGEGSYSTPVWSPRGDLIAFTKLGKGQLRHRDHDGPTARESASSSPRATITKARPSHPTAGS